MLPPDEDNLRYYLGNGATVSNAYPMLHAKGLYELQEAEGDTGMVNLARSAWAGSQRYGVVLWSGDIASNFKALQTQVRAGLNAALSGIPWWTTDIGGFHNGDINSPTFRELIVRWFQYGVFCPIFRLHGHRQPSPEPLYGAPNEIWSFGEPAYEIISKLLFLRERLEPYILEQMHLASTRGLPPMRPLFFDFPADEECVKVEDQFLFGPDLLIAPVLFEGARSRNVYLPAGTTWRDAWTDERYEGGQWIAVDAPLEKVPVFVKGEVVLPLKG